MPVPSDIPENTVGYMIRRRRLSRGWSQEFLASQVQPPLLQREISEYEIGRHSPCIRCLSRIAKALGCHAADLLPPDW